MAKILYTGPYASDATRLPHRGPTVRAIKRTLWRLGLMEGKAEGFDDLWRAKGELDVAFRKWERSRDMPGDGVYGEQETKELYAAKTKAGVLALDAKGKAWIREDFDAQNVPDEQDFRKYVTEFCLKAEANENAWHYGLVRPLDESVEPTAKYVLSDCSFYVKQAYWWARTKSGLLVADPSKQGWGSGVGNTEWYENDHPHVTAPFKVGDLAHYPGHVTICRRGGNAQTAVFSSHGKEAGPIPTNIYYRSDFQYVVRPPLKAEGGAG